MRLSYRQVSQLMTDILLVDAGKAVALTGRLKHFQRARFPGGTNVGGGPRAIYGVDQVFALVLAFRLVAMRYTPRDAAAAVDANRASIRQMLTAAWNRRNAISGGDEPGPLLMGVRPDGLEDLRRSDFADGPADVMAPVSQKQVWSWMRGVEPLPAPGLVLLDIELIVAETVAAIERLALTTTAELQAGFDRLEAETNASAVDE